MTPSGLVYVGVDSRRRLSSHRDLLGPVVANFQKDEFRISIFGNIPRLDNKERKGRGKKKEPKERREQLSYRR